jgi:hypothetical protein
MTWTPLFWASFEYYWQKAQYSICGTFRPVFVIQCYCRKQYPEFSNFRIGTLHEKVPVCLKMAKSTKFYRYFLCRQFVLEEKWNMNRFQLVNRYLTFQITLFPVISIGELLNIDILFFVYKSSVFRILLFTFYYIALPSYSITMINSPKSLVD